MIQLRRRSEAFARREQSGIFRSVSGVNILFARRTAESNRGNTPESLIRKKLPEAVRGRAGSRCYVRSPEAPRQAFRGDKARHPAERRKAYMDIFADFSQKIAHLAVAFVPMLLAIICHEVAHGWVAFKLGDPTAKTLGRLTLNPLSHFDLMGSLLFVATALAGPFILGWAKPVPVEPRYFKNPRQGMILVSLAGPLTNFILAFLFAVAYGLLIRSLLSGNIAPSEVMEFVLKACSAGVTINIIIAWFNLIPLPPLDGSHILGGFLPYSLAQSYFSIGRYGILIIIILLATGLFWNILGPLVNKTTYLIASLAGVPVRFI